MAYLVLGLILFLGIHSISIVAPRWRDATAARMGNAWRGLYSLISIAGFVLIVWGYGVARRQTVILYTPAESMRYVTAALMLPVFPLLLAAYFPGRIKSVVGHPMLVAVMLWALAHLLGSGTCVNVLLFGTFLVWAVADRVSFRWRNARPISTAPPGRWNDLIAIVVGLTLYMGFAHWLHVRWIGVQPFPS
jgi:uncharacterized membrane protein